MTVRYGGLCVRPAVGGTARIRIEKERIKTFAAEFDPQPFHLDEQDASSLPFEGLAAAVGIRPRQRCGSWWRGPQARPRHRGRGL